MEKSPTVRLNKYLANLGYASRRKIDSLLKEQIVTLNGKRVTEIGIRIDPKKDTLLIDGKRVNSKQPLIYILLNKPKGIVSTVEDEHGRKTVVSLVNHKQRIYPVGRLDQNTSGLILLTNDGELANQLTHPRFHQSKTYRLVIQGTVLPNKIELLRQGIILKDGLTQPAEVVEIEPETRDTILKMTIYEGRNHQIRRMVAALKLELLDLKRVAIGSIADENLKIGEWRELTPAEVTKLKDSA